jgi:hypothetical protein
MPNINKITKKCYSSCRKIEQNKCNLPRCVMTNGEKRQYCRLSHNYYLVKSGDHCITRKRLTKEDSSKKIGRFILDRRNKTNKTNKNNEKMKTRKAEQIALLKPEMIEAHKAITLKALKKKIMGRRIKKIVLATPSQRRAFFLKSICSSSGSCLSFGTQIKKINNLFNGFVAFDYVQSPIRRIGKISENGFVNEVKYSRYGYNAYAVLKSSMSTYTDNLMYEYIVGQFINKKNKQFPCFLETYGMFMYKTEADWDHVRRSQSIAANVLTNSLKPINIDPMNTLSLGCLQSKHICILVQHLNNPVSLADRMNINQDFHAFVRTQLIYILYQVYQPLSLLAKVFTHYDLHSDNVLLYSPATNKYIEYHYHLTNHVVRFKSLYIAKIIDYGRCFFNDTEGNIKSKDVYDKLCSLAVCHPDCGFQKGFGWLGKETSPGKAHYISSQKANQSHDLRLLEDLRGQQAHRIQRVDSILAKILDCVRYEERYGTGERTESGFPQKKINNVTDVANQLKYMIGNANRITECNALYADPKYSKYGDIHVYEDGRPAEYTYFTVP